MKKTSCSLVVFALTALSPLLVWSATGSVANPIAQESAPTPPDAAMPPESPQADVQTLRTSAAQGHNRPEAPNAAANQPPPRPSATARKNPPAPGGMGRDAPVSYHSWIEKVRAQRKARVEEHRQAVEARRNYLAPWDHPQHESVEMQREKIREAWQMHNERREQAQREYRRWTNPHGEFMKEMQDARRRLVEAEAEQQRMQADLLWQRQQEWMDRQMPPGWNNPWYYRGY